MSEPRVRKETLELDRTLAAVAYEAEKVRKDLTDLEPLAYEQAVGERAERSSKKMGWSHTDTGDPRAKLAMRELDRTAAAFLAAARQTRNLFVGGPGANSGLRGTLLGDENGAGAESDLHAAIAAQKRRRERGEYVPVATERQPNVPGARRR